MVGLALGGYIAKQIIQKHNLKWVNVLMVFQEIIRFCALLLPFAIHALSFHSIAAEIGLVCFIGIAWMLAGLEFPLMNKILMQFYQDIAVSAGATNGADHIGAFLGAIVTGVIFLPLLGIFGICLILATLNISSLILNKKTRYTQEMKPNSILDWVARTNSFVRDGVIKSWLILSGFIMCCSVSSLGCYKYPKRIGPCRYKRNQLLSLIYYSLTTHKLRIKRDRTVLISQA